MSAPQPAQPIPTPMTTTPPANYYPPAQQPPPPQAPPPQAPAPGPVGLRALQGQLRSPVPIILAGVGLLLIGAAFMLPLAVYEWQGKDAQDPLASSGFYAVGGDPGQLTLVIADHPAIPLLLVAVAAAVAMAGSPRVLLFGKLASIGLGVTAIAAAFGMAYTWKSHLEEYFDRASKKDQPDDIDSGDANASNKDLLEDIHIGFDTGLWLLIAGIVALIAAVLAVRTTATNVAPMPQQRFAYPQVQQPYQPVQAQPAAPQPHQPAQAQPAAPQPTAFEEDRDVAVHDDPPSLSIYKPPKSTP